MVRRIVIAGVAGLLLAHSAVAATLHFELATTAATGICAAPCRQIRMFYEDSTRTLAIQRLEFDIKVLGGTVANLPVPPLTNTNASAGNTSVEDADGNIATLPWNLSSTVGASPNAGFDAIVVDAADTPFTVDSMQAVRAAGVSCGSSATCTIQAAGLVANRIYLGRFNMTGSSDVRFQVGNIEGDGPGAIDLVNRFPDGAVFPLDAACGNGGPDPGEACDTGNANGTAGSCCTTTCQLVTGAPVCRAAAGACDTAEVCDGLSPACPADSRLAPGTQCRASAGICDVAESCTGAASCPADGFVASGPQCRASAALCDASESCTGSSASCPADSLATAGTVCRASAGLCDLAETCTGSSMSCPPDAVLIAGTQCRAGAGVCDMPESCTGAAACPADVFVALGSLCRASAGICDVAEGCSGASASCPADGFMASGTQCRGSTGVCDAAESCTGSSASCPTDILAAAGTPCRASAGVCDVAESCTGASVGCPAEGFVVAGTQCRASAGVCDVSENCTGASASCPGDGLATSGTPCRASAGACDVAETCMGSSISCPADQFQTEGAPCGSASQSACTNPDTCNETGQCRTNNLPCAALTDASLCSFDLASNVCDNPTEDGYLDQFSLGYTPVVVGHSSLSGYRLSAGTPSGMRYNAMIRGTPGSVVPVNLRLPYPFVTVGAAPLQIYDGASVGTPSTTSCFVPAGGILAANATPVRLVDYLALCDIPLGLCRNGLGGCVSNSDCLRPNAAGVSCIPPMGTACDGTPGPASGGSCSFSVSVQLPASGEVYLNLHVDYGLKGARVDLCQDGALARYDWAPNTGVGGLDALVSTAPAAPTGKVAIAACTDYTFRHRLGTSPVLFEATVENLNLFGPCTTAGDLDCDGVLDAADKCRYVAGNDQLADVDHDGRGDECECTDQNGDGRNTVSDIVAINNAIFSPSLTTPLCDGNIDGLCNVSDIVAANVEIFSPGSTSICARQPAPGP